MERFHWALHFFLSGRERQTVVQSLWCCRAGLSLWMREVFRFIYLSSFGEERGNPVNGDLANFEGFCCITPSVHAALGKCSRESRLQIALWAWVLRHFLTVSLEVGWVCSIFPFWNLIYHRLDDRLVFYSFTSMQAKSRESVLGRGFINPQVWGGGKVSYICNWDIFFLP